MITKSFEIRDRMTFIVAIAVKMHPGNDADRYLFARAGYGNRNESQGRYIQLMRVDGGDNKVSSNPYWWPAGERTMRMAHKYLSTHFDELKSGDVIDVEYILGETKQPKTSERLQIKESE